MILAKFTLTAGLLGSLAWGRMFDVPKGAYVRVMEQGDIAGAIVQFYTGNAKDFTDNGVQVISGRTGKTYSGKSDWRQRHYYAGDIIVINKSLVKAKDFATNGLRLAEICKGSGTRKCVDRLAAINRFINQFAILPPVIQVPAWFDIKPAPLPPPITPSVKPTAEPKPVKPLYGWRVFLAWWTWWKILLSLLLLLLIAAIVATIIYWDRVRTWRPQSKHRFTTLFQAWRGKKLRRLMWKNRFKQELADRLRTERLEDFQIVAKKGKVTVFCSPLDGSLVKKHLMALSSDLKYPLLNIKESPGTKFDLAP